MDIGGGTRFCFIIGSPVSQVKTPAVFNAWADRSGIDAVMLALDLPMDGVERFFRSMRDWQNCLGCVVTYPHKQAAFAELEECSDTAAFLGACNVVRRDRSGRLSGAMTDGVGFIAALAKNGIDPTGKAMLLLGGGGAGSAIAYGVARSGLSQLVLQEPDGYRQRALIARLRAAFPALDIQADIAADGAFDIACNASPAGMHGDPTVPFPVDRLPSHCLVCDVVTEPAATPWLRAAAERGLRTQSGREMVEGQFPALISYLMPSEAGNGGAIP